MPNSKKKRPFIDKKNAVSFHLVHRSQRDPLIADGDAPQNVLVESSRVDDDDDKERSRRKRPGSNLLIAASTDGVNSQTVKSRRRDEQAKYGVFYDDDYNYLQHLKTVGETCLEPTEGFSEVKRSAAASAISSQEKKDGRLNLPSSLFPSEIEDNIGLLNRAAPVRGPRPELDPDIVEALQSDYSDCEDSEGSFDDDFVQKANLPVDKDSSSEDDSLDGMGLHTFDDEETKSKFTHYSMSSSVMSRNDGLALLDDRFEKIFEQYDDEQIGALDGDCIDGYLTTGDPLIESVIENFKTMQAKRFFNNVPAQEAIQNVDSETDDEDEKCTDDEEDDQNVVKMFISSKPLEKWDCESILSTYSTLYNHPHIIREPVKPKAINISGRTGIPRDVLDTGGLTAANLKALDVFTCSDSVTVISQSSARNPTIFLRSKDETLEEKRDRKRVVKAMRQERRVEKKANKTAFKEEKKKQEKVLLNVQQNFKGIKLR